MPKRWRRSGDTLASGAPGPNTPARPGSPQSAASGMPCRLPDGDVSGVLKSAWASSHSTKSGRPCARQWRATPSTEPIDRLWSPPSTTGSSPAARQLPTRSPMARIQAATSPRRRRVGSVPAGSPAGRSGDRSPWSTTRQPRSSSAAAMPAVRSDAGPMRHPDWWVPAWTGTPIRATGPRGAAGVSEWMWVMVASAPAAGRLRPRIDQIGPTLEARCGCEEGPARARRWGPVCRVR